MLGSVIEHGMTPFRFQTAQKNSASLRSSIRQFEKINDVIPCSITEQCTPSYVLTVYWRCFIYKYLNFKDIVTFS